MRPFSHPGLARAVATATFGIAVITACGAATAGFPPVGLATFGLCAGAGLGLEA